MNYFLRKLCLVVLLFSYLFPCCIWAADEKKDENKKVDVGIAIVDTELLVKSFSKEHNLQSKIMNDYKEILKNVRFNQNLSQKQKDLQTQEEYKKIIEHYSYQVTQNICSVINELIKEQSLKFVANKKTFIMQDALLSTENIRVHSKNKVNVKIKTQYDGLFSQSVFSSAYNCKDITDEVLNRLKNLSSRIKILSYGRSLK